MPAFAGDSALVSPVYRDGRYVPLKLLAEGEETVEYRGLGVQAIEWPAPGKSEVVVPLLIFWSNQKTTNANGFMPRPLGDDESDSPELTAFWQTFDPVAGAGPAVDPDAYAVAALWKPAASAGTRRWALIAVGIIVLVLGVARHVDPRRSLLWLALAAVGLTGGVWAFFPADVHRRVLAASGRPAWEWVWYAGRSGQTVAEPWTPGLRFVPQSPEELPAAAPTLHLDASGRAVAISATLPPGGRAVFIRPQSILPRASSPDRPNPPSPPVRE